MYRNLFLVLCIVFLVQSCNSNNESKPSTVIPVPNNAQWWLQRHDEIVKADKSEFKVIFLGDSITQNWEGNNFGLNVWLENFGEQYAINMGFSGDKTQNLLWRIQNGELDGAAPDVVVLMIGTNNASLDSAEDIAEGVDVILDVIQTKLPNTHIILHRIFPRGKVSDPLRLITNKASNIFAKKADSENIYYLDINEHFEDVNGNVPSDIMADGLHLTTKGYAIWANALAQVIPH